MQKVLRSLLIELLPFELRVKIELLSKRRDIQNAEKQQELFKLLREYNIENIAPLGSGTNRYAFRVNGFVIKVATDHDGKIDNFKEFKMTKRLFPDVTKTYEVSENGTLLVCEYVQPFQSYGEMLMYADKIREKLAKISAVYLIGDVGIMSKNYANWGLRIGSDEPVCLDFAYIYDVKSDIFICSECKSGSVLIPNADYTKLICPNKACGKTYEFEEIRTRIGNDVHDHEIGDLSEEGYLLHESNVLTELDPNRSNYLVRSKKINEKELMHEEVEEEIPYDNFVYEEKEDITMSNNFAKALSQGMHIYEAKPIKHVSQDDQGIAFTGNISDTTRVIEATVVPNTAVESVIMQSDTADVTATIAVEPGIKQTQMIPIVVDEEPEASEETDDEYITTEPVQQVEETKAPIEEEIPEKVTPVAAAPVIEATVTAEITQPAPHKKKSDDDKLEDFGDSFINQLQMVITRFAKKVQQSAYNNEIYDEVRDVYVFETNKSHVHPDQFYGAVQNAVFHAIVNFLGMEIVDRPETGKREWILTTVKPETIPTLIFLGRWNKYRFINNTDTPAEGLAKYRSRYSDYQGLQDGWIPTFVSNLVKKIKIEEEGAQIVAQRIKEIWCVDYPIDINITVVEEPTAEKEIDKKVEKAVQTAVDQGIVKTTPIPNTDDVMITPVTKKEESETFESEDDMVAFTAALIQNNTQYTPAVEEPVDEEESEDDEEDEDYDLNVYIYPDKPLDIINLCTSDLFGCKVSIPFYKNMVDIDTAAMSTPSLADERNGMWDWLIHLTPDVMFYTNDPDKWIALNSESAQDTAKVVILDSDFNGKAVMGLYAIHGVYTVDDDGQVHPEDNIEILKKINALFKIELGSSSISHLRKSLMTTELIRDESYAAALLQSMVSGVEESEDDETEEVGTSDVITAPISDSSDIGIIQPIRRRTK